MHSSRPLHVRIRCSALQQQLGSQSRTEARAFSRYREPGGSTDLAVVDAQRKLCFERRHRKCKVRRSTPVIAFSGPPLAQVSVDILHALLMMLSGST